MEEKNEKVGWIVQSFEEVKFMKYSILMLKYFLNS